MEEITMAAAPQEVSRTTTLADLQHRSQPREAQMPTVRAGFSDLAGFELAQRAAKALAASTLVPKNYQGNLADCIVALELAQRIGASPLMVMQNLYIVHGRPAWSSQFLIAAVNQCGRFTALQYEWTGKVNTDDSWTCRAWAKDRSTGERVQGPAVSIAQAKKEGWYAKNGSKWQTLPELMLMYRAGRFLRAHQRARADDGPFHAGRGCRHHRPAAGRQRALRGKPRLPDGPRRAIDVEKFKFPPQPHYTLHDCFTDYSRERLIAKGKDSARAWIGFNNFFEIVPPQQAGDRHQRGPGDRFVDMRMQSVGSRLTPRRELSLVAAAVKYAHRRNRIKEIPYIELPDEPVQAPSAALRGGVPPRDAPAHEPAAAEVLPSRLLHRAPRPGDRGAHVGPRRLPPLHARLQRAREAPGHEQAAQRRVSHPRRVPADPAGLEGRSRVTST
jgi:hypothetical protein